MAINISAWSIRHPLPPIIMAAAIVVLGFISFNRLPITRMPNVDAPVISVTIGQFGASPRGTGIEGHQGDRGRRLERRGRSPHHVPDQGRHIEHDDLFRLETNTDRAINDVKDAVTRARADLPRGIDEPLVQRVDIAGLPILTYAAIAPGKTPSSSPGSSRTWSCESCKGCAGGQHRAHRNRRARDRVGLDPGRLQAVG